MLLDTQPEPEQTAAVLAALAVEHIVVAVERIVAWVEGIGVVVGRMVVHNVRAWTLGLLRHNANT